jgi:YOP proteins translocation protein K (YscK)
MTTPTITERAAARDTAAGRWAQAVVRFNLDPVEYADPSWLPPWAAQATPRVRQELSRGMLREQQLETLCDWVIDDRGARLFMMDAATLDRLGLAIGIAAHRDTLRQVVRRERLTALRECFGAASSTLWLAVAETVPRADSPLALQWSPFDAKALVERLKRDGKRQLLRLIDDADPAQRATSLRAAFCLPRPSGGTDGAAHGGADESRLAPLQPAQAIRMTDAIVGDLLKPWASQWTWLF